VKTGCGGFFFKLGCAAAVLLLISCGYRLVGSGQLPGGVSTMSVSILENRTVESGLETIVTNALVDELTRRRQNMVASAGQADATLSGTILSLKTSTVARGGGQTALKRRVTINLALTLVDNDGKVIWENRSLSAAQDYDVSGNSAETDANRRRAIDQVSQRLAEYAYERMVDPF
jgi:outer membrane lipopolysaccharide assembly protein LptE/RlpB